MKIFLSSLENSTVRLSEIGPMKYNLISYYYGRNRPERTKAIMANSELIMIDSGAHTFQKGTKLDWVGYTEEYADWIRKHDAKNVVGFFEMDVDNRIGYNNVLYLRKILDNTSSKIIPVWHKNRGVKDFSEMCERYSGRVVAITGFKNEDIQDDQYIHFLLEAWKYGCKVHCLGMTRRKVLDKVPFDYVDSSTWTQCALYGHLNGRKLRNAPTVEERRIVRRLQSEASYRVGMHMQDEYEKKWAVTDIQTKGD